MWMRTALLWVFIVAVAPACQRAEDAPLATPAPAPPTETSRAAEDSTSPSTSSTLTVAAVTDASLLVAEAPDVADSEFDGVIPQIPLEQGDVVLELPPLASGDALVVRGFTSEGVIPTYLGEGGTDVRLDSCGQVAPGVWEFHGEVITPAGFEGPVDGALAVSFPEGDVVTVWALDTTVHGPGRFAFRLDESLRSGARTCGLSTGSSYFRTSVVEATPSAMPLTWTAPAGSLHELGIGWMPSRGVEDPRAGWAEFTWSDEKLPFNLVVVVNPATADVGVRRVSGSVDADLGCLSVKTDVLLPTSESEAHVIQERDCPWTADIPDGATDFEPLPGFTAWSWPGGWNFISGPIGDTTLRIEAPTLDGILAVLPALEVRENPDVAGIPDSPYVDADLDSVIASTLVAEGLSEVARFPYRDGGWYVLGSGASGLWSFEIRSISTGWSASGGGGGGWDSCLSVSGSADQAGWVIEVVVADPNWRVEIPAPDGGWMQVETVNGAYIEWGTFGDGVTIDNWFPDVRARVYTESGEPAPCDNNHA